MMRRLQDQFSPFVRFYMGGQAIITWYNATSNPGATLFSVGMTDDGSIALFVLGLLGVLMLLDLFVNDWTPDCIHMGRFCLNLNWWRSWRHRHWLFVGIAACYAAMPNIAEYTGDNIAVMLVCYWNSLVCMAAAFLDAGERSRRLWWRKACN